VGSPAARARDRDGIPARLIEYQLGGKDQQYRLLCSIVDPRKAPAIQLANLYPRRWTIETVSASSLRASSRSLRSARSDACGGSRREDRGHRPFLRSRGTHRGPLSPAVRFLFSSEQKALQLTEEWRASAPNFAQAGASGFGPQAEPSAERRRHGGCNSRQPLRRSGFGTRALVRSSASSCSCMAACTGVKPPYTWPRLYWRSTHSMLRLFGYAINVGLSVMRS
jgi:hypothetical protein